MKIVSCKQDAIKYIFQNDINDSDLKLAKQFKQ